MDRSESITLHVKNFFYNPDNNTFTMSRSDGYVTVKGSSFSSQQEFVDFMERVKKMESIDVVVRLK